MTTDTLTLTAFLLARIEEDEAVAKAAVNPEPIQQFDKTLVDDGVWTTSGYQVRGVEMIIYDEGDHTVEQAEHIARHDPARVLAECAAKRAIVELHDEREGQYCSSCAYDTSSYGDMDPDDYPCKTIKALAAVYADHDDYRAEWAL